MCTKNFNIKGSCHWIAALLIIVSRYYIVRRYRALFAILREFFVLLENIHFYVVANVITIILWMKRLVKWLENYIFQLFKTTNVIILWELCILVKWFSNFKYYMLNYYTNYTYYLKDYFSEVDYLIDTCLHRK